MTPKKYQISTSPIQGVCKQSAVWASDGNSGLYPLVFLQRPKWIKNDEAWAKIVASVRLDLPYGTEID